MRAAGRGRPTDAPFSAVVKWKRRLFSRAWQAHFLIFRRGHHSLRIAYPVKWAMAGLRCDYQSRRHFTGRFLESEPKTRCRWWGVWGRHVALTLSGCPAKGAYLCQWRPHQPPLKTPLHLARWMCWRKQTNHLGHTQFAGLIPMSIGQRQDSPAFALMAAWLSAAGDPRRAAKRLSRLPGWISGIAGVAKPFLFRGRRRRDFRGPCPPCRSQPELAGRSTGADGFGRITVPGSASGVDQWRVVHPGPTPTTGRRPSYRKFYDGQPTSDKAASAGSASCSWPIRQQRRSSYYPFSHGRHGGRETAIRLPLSTAALRFWRFKADRQRGKKTSEIFRQSKSSQFFRRAFSGAIGRISKTFHGLVKWKIGGLCDFGPRAHLRFCKRHQPIPAFFTPSAGNGKLRCKHYRETAPSANRS